MFEQEKMIPFFNPLDNVYLFIGEPEFPVLISMELHLGLVVIRILSPGQDMSEQDLRGAEVHLSADPANWFRTQKGPEPSGSESHGVRNGVVWKDVYKVCEPYLHLLQTSGECTLHGVSMGISVDP